MTFEIESPTPVMLFVRRPGQDRDTFRLRLGGQASMVLTRKEVVALAADALGVIGAQHADTVVMEWLALQARGGEMPDWVIEQAANVAADPDWVPTWHEFRQEAAAQDLEREQDAAERRDEGPDPDDARDSAIDAHAAELLRAMGRGAAAMPAAVCCGGA